MPSSDCELLVTKYCPPPHVDVINSENSGVKGKVKTIRTAEEEEVAPDKHGDVNKQNTPLRHEPSSYGFRGDCQCATEAVCGAVADLDGNTTQNGHGMNGYVNGAVSIEGEKRCNLACNDREILCQSLEKRHVHDVYEDTAHHFKHARYKPWPKVKEFLEELPAGSIVADIGCGHGKYLDINPSVYKLGSDRSGQLMQIAAEHGHEVMVCDNLDLPYRTGCFDAVISVGVIHHFTSPQRRLQALTELTRVLHPGGRLMVYVWALEQKHRKFGAQDVLVPWHLKQKTVKEGTQLQLDLNKCSGSPANRDHNGLIQNSICCQQSSDSKATKTAMHKDSNNQRTAFIKDGSQAANSVTGNILSVSNASASGQRTEENNAFSGINTSQGSVGEISNFVIVSKEEANKCQSSFSSSKAPSRSNEMTSQSAICQSYQEHKSKDRSESGKPIYISNQDHTETGIARKYSLSDQKEHGKNWSSLKMDHKHNITPGWTSISDFSTAIVTKSDDKSDKPANSSFGAVIRKKLSSFFSFGNNKEKQKASQAAVTDHVPVPLFPSCCAAPVICSGFAVREFPQSSQPDRGRKLQGEQNTTQGFSNGDMTEQLVWGDSVENWGKRQLKPSHISAEYDDIATNPRSDLDMVNQGDQNTPDSFKNNDLRRGSASKGSVACDSKKVVMSSQMTPKYASIVDSLRLQLMSCAAEQHSQKPFPQSCPGVSGSLPHRVLDRHNNIEEINSCQGQEETQSENNMPGEMFKKSNNACEQSNRAPGLNVSNNQSGKAKFEEDCVQFTLGDDDSHWLTTTGEAIQRMEMVVYERSNHKRIGGYSTGQKFNGLHNGEIVTGKISSPRLQRLSQSSSVSSFSSDNFSDSEVEETPIMGDLDTKQKGPGASMNSGSQFEIKPSLKLKQSNSPRLAPKNDRKIAKESNMSYSSPDESRDTYKRYYHVFRENELDDLITRNLKCLKIVHSAYDHANWYIIAEKLSI